jgi:amino acid transporter
MPRIFLGLAVLDGLALVATCVLGFFHVPRGESLLHFNLGLYTVLGNLLVHCIIFIYFLGTGRLVKEVALAYGIPDEPLPKLTRELKRSAFPPALFAMLLPIAAAASGMGSEMQQWPAWVHAALAVASLGVNGWAFVVEYRNVCTNARALDELFREVDRIRAERGLPSNAEALRQEEQSR